MIIDFLISSCAGLLTVMTRVEKKHNKRHPTFSLVTTHIMLETMLLCSPCSPGASFVV